jgi:membrane protein
MERAPLFHDGPEGADVRPRASSSFVWRSARAGSAERSRRHLDVPAQAARAFAAATSAFLDHKGFFLAAGVSFFLLLCITPILFLTVSAAGFVVASDQVSHSVLIRLSHIVPVYREELQVALRRVFADRAVSGVVGTLVLLVFSTQLFAALRLVMNAVFGVKRSRSLVHGTLYDVMMVVVMGALFLGSVLVTDLFEWVRVLILKPAGAPIWGMRLLFIGPSLAFSTALFFLMYRYFPNREVPIRPALAGAVLASVLWEFSKQLFRWFITYSGLYDQIYGGLAVLVAVSMFAYYTGIVLILGAEFAAALEKQGAATAAPSTS